MPRLFVYRQVHDTGIAPHISRGGILTLTICKPQIRQQARDGDYIMALVATSDNKDVVGPGPDKYFKVSYVYRVTEKVPMKNYRRWCLDHASNKIPNNITFSGNCQYDSDLEWMPGPHGPEHQKRNVSGCFSVISREFGAWTFEHPYTLTISDMEAIGVPEEKIRGRGIGHAVYELSTEQEAYLSSLMLSAPTTHLTFQNATASANAILPTACKGSKCGSKTRKAARRTRKTRKARKAMQSRRY